ncbi:MAG: phage holin family protein [Planctomycetaceae bacterium]|nr:MAG: phage holin family protein [Planctomycetaceae bacterium]
MVDETTMNLQNESKPTPPSGVANDMAELTSDVMSLAQLQFELFTTDCRTGMRGLLTPVVLLLGAGIAAIGTVPVGLLLMAELLVQVAGLSRVAALSIAVLSGLLMAVVLGAVGWSVSRGVGRVFKRSREELIRNLAWIKHSLHGPEASPTKPPQIDGATSQE